MLKLVEVPWPGRLKWGPEDVGQMAKILGPDNAVKRWAPYNPSIIKLALRKNVSVSEFTERRLEDEIKRRQWLAQFAKRSDQSFPPDGILKKFFPHQRADVEYLRLAGLPAFLVGHQPGVGKTLIALQHAARVGARRVLVVCPNSAKDQWAETIREWYDFTAITILEGTKVEQILRATTEFGFVIAHWESLVHARVGLLTSPWDLVIADEAHRAGNRNAQRTETLFELTAKHRLALTAHPYSKSPEDLFAILKFLYPERYTSFWRYFAMHVEATPKPFGGYEIEGAKRPKLLKWEIAPFTLRRTKKSLGWQPPVRIKRTAELTKRGAKEYDRLKKAFFAEMDGLDGNEKILAIPSALARVTRMRQYLIDPSLVGAAEPSVKFPVVLEVMDEMDGPPVIFTMFAAAGRSLGKFLRKKGKRVGFIDGDVSNKDRTKAKKKFLAGELDALIITEAGGESLNLGKHGYVILLDLPWTPRGVEQVEGRVDRPEENTGKMVQTTVYRIVVKGSYEERQERRLQARDEDFHEVFTVADYRRLFE